MAADGRDLRIRCIAKRSTFAPVDGVPTPLKGPHPVTGRSHDCNASPMSRWHDGSLCLNAL